MKFSARNLSIVFYLILALLLIIELLSGLAPVSHRTNDYEECTSVIATGAAAKNGRAILMKNRDTDETMNKPIFYPASGGHYAYTMVNSGSMGINEKGLAVMNTVLGVLAFNGSGLDNTQLNRWIAQHCETVDQVCYELNNTAGEAGPGKRFGGTCVGVIDRFGKGAFIEISGVEAYARFIVDGYDSEANHPRVYPGYASGPSGRDQYAFDIMNSIHAQKGAISWEDVAQNVSRYVHNKEYGNSNFTLTGEICNNETQAAMVAVSGDARYDGKLNCMWGEYGNPPIVGLFVPTMPQAGQPPSILDAFWNQVWQKSSYARDPSGNYNPGIVRQIQSYTFFAEDYTFSKYDELLATLPDGLSSDELRTRLQDYVNSSVQTATEIYMEEPEVTLHTISHETEQYRVTTVSNSTISDFQSSNQSIEISFDATGPPDSTGFAYIEIPTELWSGSFTITAGPRQHVVDNPLRYENNSLLNVTYNHPANIRISITQAPSVSIVSHIGYIDSEGNYRVVGEVQNVGSQPVNFIQVTATFYDFRNSVIDSRFDLAMLNVLLVQRKSPFEIALLDVAESSRVNHYSLSVTYMETSSIPMKLQILSGSSYLDPEGNMHIVGNLKNAGSEVLVNAKVVATFYDASSHVVAAALVGFDPEITGDINPNQTVQFEIALDKSRAQYVKAYALAAESNQYAMIPEYSSSIIIIVILAILFIAVCIRRVQQEYPP